MIVPASVNLYDDGSCCIVGLNWLHDGKGVDTFMDNSKLHWDVVVPEFLSNIPEIKRLGSGAIRNTAGTGFTNLSLLVPFMPASEMNDRRLWGTKVHQGAFQANVNATLNPSDLSAYTTYLNPWLNEDKYTDGLVYNSYGRSGYDKALDYIIANEGSSWKTETSWNSQNITDTTFFKWCWQYKTPGTKEGDWFIGGMMEFVFMLSIVHLLDYVGNKLLSAGFLSQRFPISLRDCQGNVKTGYKFGGDGECFFYNGTVCPCALDSSDGVITGFSAATSATGNGQTVFYPQNQVGGLDHGNSNYRMPPMLKLHI